MSIVEGWNGRLDPQKVSTNHLGEVWHINSPLPALFLREVSCFGITVFEYIKQCEQFLKVTDRNFISNNIAD
jgi:hypothetical protein